MSRINMGGVVKGGLLAGLVINVLEMILNGAILAKPWQEAMDALGITQGAGMMAIYIIGAFFIGILSVWMYAAVRPRLGEGPGTAIKVGLFVWALAMLWPGIGFLAMGIFPSSLIVVSIVWELIEFPLATVIGAWAYKEDAPDTAASVPGMPAAPEPKSTTTPPQPPTA